LNKPNPLHRALAIAFAAPAMTLLAAEPGDADPKPAAQAPVQVAQAQVLPAAQATSTQEKIEVTAQREHYRGDVPLENLPQAVQVISLETIKEIGAVKLNDILDIATGVARQNSFGGLWDGFAIRGFAGDLNLPSGYLVNGFRARGFGGVRDTSSIEKMEVQK